MMGFVFAAAMAFVSWKAAREIAFPFALFQQTRKWSSLSLCAAWVALCLGSAGSAVWMAWP